MLLDFVATPLQTTRVILPMNRGHLPDVAKLHASLLNGLLSGLGERTIRTFYRAYLASPRCIAFVEEVDSHLRGFVLGSDDPARMRTQVVGTRQLLRTALAASRRPKTWPWLLGTKADFDPHMPELTYIASTASGVGTQLLEAFERAARARGLQRYELSVEASNERAIRFYEGKGLQRTATYEQFGASHFRYQRTL